MNENKNQTEFPERLCHLGVAKWCSSSDRAALWSSYYVLRWADGTSGKTQVTQLRSWTDDKPERWPLAVGFYGARSALDHLFWPLGSLF